MIDLNDRAIKFEQEAKRIHAEHYGVRPHFGPQPKLKYIKPTIFYADSILGLHARLKIYKISLGVPRRGNSRHGDIRYFYAELVQYFVTARERGEILPSSHLSKAQLTPQLFAILNSHGYVDNGLTYEHLQRNSHARHQVFHKVERIFKRIIQSIKKTPPQKY